MNTSLNLQQSLKQQLSLSPQLIQTFEVLAMSNLELQQKIRAEIEQNPALEIPNEKNISIERLAQRSEKGSIVDDYSDKSKFGSDYTRLSSSYNQEASDNNQQFLEGALSSEESLQEYLLRQLGCMKLDEELYTLSHLIISNLNHNGFHNNELSSLAPISKKKELNKALLIVQSLDPPGIAVKDFRESLLLQAKIEGLNSTELFILEQLINDHLEKLRMGKFKEVSKIINEDEEQVELLYEYLKTLNPYPASQFDSRETQYIIPELRVKNVEGRLQLILNKGMIPELIIDENFSSLTGNKDDPHYKETLSYIKEAIKSANQLISSIDMRNETIKKIGLLLLEEQYQFFLEGPKALKPLTYKDLATRLNLHETTISRAVISKYIDTDWGIIPIKELFSSALSTSASASGEISKTAVKEKVEEIIKNHTGDKPLSDQKISDILQNEGIKIARRTVNKYRKELNLDSSYLR
ncbi:MAG: RNA polymerase sigma-54 factor [Spirochaetia bacterium]|nr:RNA polymerase sigma-54 factor [Spirochaetia bacterium]